MELIIGFIVIALSILGAALSRQLTDECKAWTPWIIKYLINRAINKLPDEERDRFEEEWLAHVNELPGEVGKIIAALGLLSAAQKDIVTHKRTKAQIRHRRQYHSDFLCGSNNAVGSNSH